MVRERGVAFLHVRPATFGRLVSNYIPALIPMIQSVLDGQFPGGLLDLDCRSHVNHFEWATGFHNDSMVLW